MRRAFLCGDSAEHRRQWLVDAISQQSTVFCIDVLAYAVMANHLHLVVTTQPGRAAELTALAVAERWAVLFPLRDDDGKPLPPDLDYLQAQAADVTWVEERRHRLSSVSSVSWFMKLFKERIARRANREDRCTGHFWEGRFTSVPLLDQAAVTACMAYIDLNPVRAQLADRPETSDFTSIQTRITIRQEEHRRAALHVSDALPAPTPTAVPALSSVVGSSGWLTPLGRCVPHSDAERSPGPLSVDDYLTLVDTTGRVIRSNKRGAIPTHLAPILARLDLDLETWLDAMRSPRRFLGGAIGSAAARAAEALRRGVRWVVDKAKIHRPPAVA